MFKSLGKHGVFEKRSPLFPPMLPGEACHRQSSTPRSPKGHRAGTRAGAALLYENFSRSSKALQRAIKCCVSATMPPHSANVPFLKASERAGKEAGRKMNFGSEGGKALDA
ncbi:MAG: hypothetical protein JO068_11660 [Hyphomicrobiales bacterium]|nr:hypothetical protein [Hyphomicrobiales bacterium]MBV9518769.1 hypothetical protein [Hyphomicrobiales bacterium]